MSEYVEVTYVTAKNKDAIYVDGVLKAQDSSPMHPLIVMRTLREIGGEFVYSRVFAPEIWEHTTKSNYPEYLTDVKFLGKRTVRGA